MKAVAERMMPQIEAEASARAAATAVEAKRKADGASSADPSVKKRPRGRPAAKQRPAEPAMSSSGQQVQNQPTPQAYTSEPTPDVVVLQVGEMPAWVEPRVVPPYGTLTWVGDGRSRSIRTTTNGMMTSTMPAMAGPAPGPVDVVPAMEARLPLATDEVPATDGTLSTDGAVEKIEDDDDEV